MDGTTDVHEQELLNWLTDVSEKTTIKPKEEIPTDFLINWVRELKSFTGRVVYSPARCLNLIPSCVEDL